MIKIGIYGYGNLGKGVESAIKQNPDMELVGVFTRRNPKDLKTLTNVNVYSINDVLDFKNKIDVMILCGGSRTDLPVQTPMLAEHFNVVDSFDTHANINQHFKNVDIKASKSNKTAIISVGWDPGMFSLNRLYANTILVDGSDYTFWGKGVSQGHSDAIRRIEGVVDARQYTVPVLEALEEVRNGKNPTLSTRQKHTRECYVVAKEGYDLNKIEKEIKEMPNYFSDYDTYVHFISLDELRKNHSNLPHGGFVIRSGKTGLNEEFNNTIEYSLKLDSNPHFTACVLVAYARACKKLNDLKDYGCKTVFDIAPKYLSFQDEEYIRNHML